MSPASRSLMQLGQRHWFRLLLIVLLALALRLHLLDMQSLWRDEIASVAFARLPLSQLWSAWMVHETNPPLYYTLLHFWIGLFGESEFAVRSLSALIGTATVVCVGILGRQLKSERAGEFAALLAAVSALQVYFSQEARGYTLGATAALLSLIAVAELTSRLTGMSKPRGAFAEYGFWLLYIGATTTALYTHTTMVMLPILTSAFVAWLLMSSRSNRLRFALTWIGANLICLAAWSWWGWITMQQLSVHNPNIAWMVFPSNGVVLRTAEHLYGLRRSGLTLMPLSAVTALALGAAAIMGVVRARHPAKWLLVAIAFAAPLVVLAASRYRPVFMERTVFWTQSAFLVLAAAGLSSIPRTAVRLGITALLAVVMLGDTIDSQRVFVKQPWREAVTAIKNGWRDGDVVVVSGAATGTFVQQYCRLLACNFPIIALRNPGDEVTWGPGLFRGHTIDRSSLHDRIRRYQRVWVPAEPAFNPQPVLELIAFRRSTLNLPFTAYEVTSRMSVTTWTPLPLTGDEPGP